MAEAAAWARSIQPGRGLPALDQPRAPAEIVDLTDTVRRSLEWLDAELAAEQRRAAEAAHALRTPVAVLVARLDELPQTAEFDSLRSDVFALSRMVTQFLSSSAADRLEILDDVRANLRTVAERVVAELFPMAAARGIDIVLSAAHGSQQVQGSADAIALALTNLIENAIHHAGSGLIEVSVGPGPVLSVRDHGSGFPEMGRDDLTEPFLRGIGAPR
ncbi:MAG: sensor histidine kinase, partial [Pseudomonadota bacterium]